jgi:hypothetical protein
LGGCALGLLQAEKDVMDDDLAEKYIKIIWDIKEIADIDKPVN